MQHLKLLVCVKGKTEQNYTNQFCLYVHLIEQFIGQKELKLVNPMSVRDLYSCTLTMPFLSSA